ncbi:MAG: hypothetical protein KC561_13500 [Myxococcales bacterium]|nr:hypothetical protein [Myxococcales bacterium]
MTRLKSVLSVFALGMVAACSDQPSPPSPAENESADAYDDTYENDTSSADGQGQSDRDSSLLDQGDDNLDLSDTQADGSTDSNPGADLQTSDAGPDGYRDSDAQNTGDVAQEPDAIEEDPPTQLEPCLDGDCWDNLGFGSACGTLSLEEDFGSGRYASHRVVLDLRAGVVSEVRLERLEGTFQPQLIVNSNGTIYDGERTLLASTPVSVQETSVGSDEVSVRLQSSEDTALEFFVTSRDSLDSGFSEHVDSESAYRLSVTHDCEHAPGDIISPPNFDPDDIVGGYYVLPYSQPPGLYTRKADACARGNRLLVDVLYTVAAQWAQRYPDLAPIRYLDLNEGPCSSADHQTHDDGTHVDIVVDCATYASCDDIQPAIELAELFVDTGQVCGIIFNDDAVQDVINPYFESNYDYTPWWNTFMRTVSGHLTHFHVRVMPEDGDCN